MAATTSLRQQQTLSSPVTVKGIGYWSGLTVQIHLKPAAENTGVLFVRPDLPGCPSIKAHVSNRVQASLRTVLDNRRIRVEMIEHLMAALSGLRIDNCEVWLDRDELPGLDGSANPYVEAIQQVGVVKQTALREKLVVTHPMRVGNSERWIEARPTLNKLMFEYELHFVQCLAIGRQNLKLEMTPETFVTELAPARTFILQADALKLREQGLCEHVQYSDLLVFGEQGVVDNELRFDNECVRHKMLDLAGDLALAPFDLIGHFIAHRSGHDLHTQMLHRLLQEGRFVESSRAA